MIAKDYLWILPFFSFFIGFHFLSFFTSVNTFFMPNVVGKSLSEVVRIFSDYNLNMRLLAEKTDPDLPEGTILAQAPENGTKVKQRQNVFVVVSKHPPMEKAPLFIGLSEKECIEKAHVHAIRLKIVKLITNYPAEQCFAQLPSEGTDLEEKIVTLYISQEQSGQVIMPCLTGKPVYEALETLNKNNFEIEIIRGNMSASIVSDDKVQIVDHKPRAGTIIDPLKQKSIKIYIEE